MLWGTSFPVIKIGLNYVNPYSFVFLRFLVASALMLILMAAMKKLSFPMKQKKLILFLGVINGAAYVMQYVGMNFTTAAKAALFVGLSAVWVALLSPWILKEKLGTNKIFGVLAALVGIVFVTTNLDFSLLTGGQLFGDLLLVATGFTWAIFMIYNKTLVTNDSNLLPSLTWILLATLLPMLPFVFSTGSQTLALPVQAWLIVLYTAVACWIIPFYLFLEGLKNISASTSTILLLSQIVVAAAISGVWLNEVFTIVSAIGAVFIILATVLVSYRTDRT